MPAPGVFIIEAIASGAIVGLALGLTGGGGSIFAVPLLIYLLGLTPDEAVPLSLVAVALTALVGAVQSVRQRLTVWQPAVVFAVGGIVGAPIGLTVARHVGEAWLLGGFGALALTIGSLMWRASRVAPAQSTAVRARVYATDAGPVCRLEPEGQLRFTAPCAVALSLTGIGTGFLSGLFGVGGGFLIVPALVLVTRMGIHRAVATSLLIITAIGFAGAAGAIWQGRIDWAFLLPFAAGGAGAMLAGRQLAARLAGPRLQRTFSVLIIGVGVVMLIDGVT